MTPVAPLRILRLIVTPGPSLSLLGQAAISSFGSSGPGVHSPWMCSQSPGCCHRNTALSPGLCLDPAPGPRQAAPHLRSPPLPVQVSPPGGVVSWGLCAEVTSYSTGGQPHREEGVLHSEAAVMHSGAGAALCVQDGTTTLSLVSQVAVPGRQAVGDLTCGSALHGRLQQACVQVTVSQ